MQNTTTQPPRQSLAHSLAIGQLFQAMHNNAVVRAWGLERIIDARIPITLKAIKNGRVLEITAQHGTATPELVTPEHVPALIKALNQDNQRRESQRHFDQLVAVTHQHLERVGA
jgi:hypothetical protein